MKSRLYAIPFLLAFAATVHAAEPPKPGAIKFPEVTLPLTPPPKVDPAAVPRLTADTLYVISSDAPFLSFASPPDLVKVTKVAGPLTVFGRFIDGSGKPELRTFPAKHIAIIEAVGAGKVEIIAVPVGATDEKDATRKGIDVDAGQGPRPPPDVDPKPDDPIPPPKPVTSFRVIWVIESGDPAKVSVADNKAVRDYLTANCTMEEKWPSWRRFDPQQEAANETPNMKALWVAVKPQLTVQPCVVIEVNGKATIENYPASAAAAVALFKKYKDGK